ncbi:MAG: OmpA family protein [Saprospiraceae bacterium]|nr:OmpA family protein [Saprospiraceae bacterium]
MKKYFLLYSICFLNFLNSQILHAQNQIPKHDEVEIKNVEALNSTAYDFAPIKYGNSVIITSDRGGAEKYNPESNRFGNCKCRCGDSRAIQSSCTDLFISDKIGDTYATPSPLKGNLNGSYHDGVITFSPDKNTMYFTRNDSRAKDRLNLKLYSAEKDGDRWGMVKMLPFNSDTFNTAHPSLSADGKTLYFSSNRPGTTGGMDIWKIERNGDDWGTPMNLGSSINTDKNEIFPYINDENVLYFSSEGHTGLGGLDIFYAKQGAEGWMMAKNLGTPFNSDADDLCFTSSPGDVDGFFVSNRAGGQGGDDIYSFKWDKKKAKFDKKILVYDAATNQIIPDATVSINGNFGDEVVDTRKMLTNDKGIIIHNVSPEMPYNYLATKSGYLPNSLKVNYDDLMKNPDEPYRIPLTKAPSMPFEGIVKNKDNGEIIPNALVTMRNLKTGEIRNITAGPDGKFNTNIDCDTEYELVTTKDGFEIDKSNILPIPCDKVAPQKKEILLKPKYYIGQIIALKNIYYDFDKFNIRRDAAIELDYVVNLLKTYPSMELELGSHTDCRGSFKYNDRLSDNRAKSAVKYILEKGQFAPSRITARGYGEYQLMNRCKDRVRCSEVEHQLNRRTEIKITKFNEAGVTVDPNSRK